MFKNLFGIDKLAKELEFAEIKKMLKMLDEGLTEKTQLVAVPGNPSIYRITILPNGTLQNRVQYVDIPIIHFFGMYIGYDPGLDILIFTQERG